MWLAAKSNGTKLVRDLEKKLGFHDTHQTSEQEDNMPQVSPGVGNSSAQYNQSNISDQHSKYKTFKQCT